MATSDSSSSDLKSSVLMNLRSVTQSRKGGVPLNSLDRDYRDLLGTSIPFRELGFNSLQAFLKSIPNVISLKQKDGQLVAEGIADSSTAHIVSLVSRQKMTKAVTKPSRKNRFSSRRGAPPSRFTIRNSKPAPSRSYLQRSSSSSSSKYENHSKPNRNTRDSKEVRPKSPKPPSPVPRTSPQLQRKHAPPPPRKYEIAPRFLKLQNRNREQTNSNEVLDVDFDISRPRTPENRPAYINERQVNNHFIRSPRSLQVSVPVASKNDRLKDLECAATSKEYIEIHAEIKNLPLKYVTTTIGQKKRNMGYISTLTLGDKQYRTYPDVAVTAAGAEEMAATLAMKAIQENLEHMASLPVSTIENADDVKKLINRIEEIVYEKPSGMFTNGIIHEYESKYNEVLPENWLRLLQQSTVLEIEELDERYGRVPEGVSCIVRRAKLSSGSTTPSSVSETERIEFPGEDYSLRTIVRKDYQPNVPSLTVPFGNQWAVYIVDVSKTIAARLIDYDSLYLNMCEQMKTYYSTDYLPAVEIREGLLYAACQADSDIFHRVLAKKIKENEMVECYYVDEGFFADIPKSDLQELSSEILDFWIPYQAIHMTLYDLEDYPYNPDDLKFLLARSLIAVIKRSTAVPEYFPDDPAINKDIYSAVLFDTEGNEDINENEIIKEKILESFAAKLPMPSICASGYYLTHVDDNGDIYIRKLPPDSWLEEDLEKLAPSFEEACLQNATVPHGKVCVAKYEDGVWYRAKNTSVCSDPEKVEVLFIDYGNTSVVSTKEVCELQPFSEFLSCLGGQAIKCELNNLNGPDYEWTSAAISKLMQLAPIEEELLIRVIRERDEKKKELPKVNLYKRTYKDNGDSFIITINESLATEHSDLFQSTSSLNSSNRSSTLSLNFQNDILPPVPRTAVSNFNSTTHAEGSFSAPVMSPSSTNVFKWVTTPDNIKSPDALENHNPLPLKTPEIPDIGKQFDVYVTMAANPYHFYVQPYKTVKEMNDLMTQMEQFYSSEENLIEMDLSLLKENGFYAVKHSDNCWYRAQLHSVISNDPVLVLVRYVDFGDLVTVSMIQLQSLWSKFRLLPMQGIEASLSGVKPLDKDWKPLQCVKFADMIKEKKYVSIVQGKRLKENKGSTVLAVDLILIDVEDPNEDVYIHELLIKNGMAQPA